MDQENYSVNLWVVIALLLLAAMLGFALKGERIKYQKAEKIPTSLVECQERLVFANRQLLDVLSARDSIFVARQAWNGRAAGAAGERQEAIGESVERDLQ